MADLKPGLPRGPFGGRGTELAPCLRSFQTLAGPSSTGPEPFNRSLPRNLRIIPPFPAASTAGLGVGLDGVQGFQADLGSSISSQRVWRPRGIPRPCAGLFRMAFGHLGASYGAHAVVAGWRRMSRFGVEWRSWGHEASSWRSGKSSNVGERGAFCRVLTRSDALCR
jgi:hypothetical protein